MAFNHVMVLMQAEVERFHAGVSMLHDYYNAKVQEVLQDDSVALVSKGRGGGRGGGVHM